VRAPFVRGAARPSNQPHGRLRELERLRDDAIGEHDGAIRGEQRVPARAHGPFAGLEAVEAERSVVRARVDIAACGDGSPLTT
jgi:hypothetical protein